MLRAQNQALALEVNLLKRQQELELVPVSDSVLIAGLDAEPFGATPVDGFLKPTCRKATYPAIVCSVGTGDTGGSLALND